MAKKIWADGSHIIGGQEVWVEDGYVVGGYLENPNGMGEMLPAAVYRGSSRSDEWTKVDKVKVETYRKGNYRLFL